MKRLFDISLSIVLLVPALIVILATACVVFAVERINPFYSQIRLGKDEKPFRIYKIRTMEPTTQSVATHQAPDYSVTRTGRFLRKVKIDEFPQLLNVIFGQMSLVGPRPGLPQQIELAEARRKHGVFKVLPGITGLGQVLGIDMSEPERLSAIDAEYLNTQSFRKDFLILLHTFTFRKPKGQRYLGHETRL